MFISIIMPVFNCENYVLRAIESVINQDFDNFELIIVNDGSTDQSLDIINQYNNNKNIKIINKKNTGVSDSRNRALEISSGDWILFLDSDDWIDDNSLVRIKEYVDYDPEVDLFLSNMLECFEGQRRPLFNLEYIEKCPKNEIINSIISFYFEEMHCNTKYGNCRCIGGKVFRREIIKKQGVFFPVTLKSFEDGMFNLRYIEGCNKISLLGYTFYNYCKNPSSVTNKFYETQYTDIKLILKVLKDYLGEVGYNGIAYNYTCLEFYLRLINTAVSLWERKKSVVSIKEYYNYLKFNLDSIDGKLKSKDKVLLLLSKYNLFSIVHFIYSIKNKKQNSFLL
ncbi:glycosyltransferase family A protein [Desulfosporosinus sp. FKB]|uniref:glycosyltransferase family A protein n=1 Tax=Desulfosporosinus sp. FKB TaxID=1969835 RepID=UPI000B49F04A|nr:glycosyltransferase family A protein [Desulfosporosinus sp. FKB]